MPNLPDLMDPEVQACPYGLYATLRARSPVYRMPSTGFHLVTSYDLCMQVIRQPDLFASGVSPATLRPGGVPSEVVRVFSEDGWLPKASCSTSDPPRHTWVRALLDRLFTASKVRAMVPWMESTSTQLIDQFADAGECEFVRSFAHPFPMIVIAEQIGVSPDMIDTFKSWSDAIVEPFSMMVSPEREVECARLFVDMQKFFAAGIEARRLAPRDDLLTVIAQTRDDEGELLAMDEALTIIAVDLLASGNDTTASALASGMRLLIENPHVQERLAADPALIPAFAEEVVRLESPAQGMFRRVVSPTVLAGTALQAGDLLSLRFGAANRDEQLFPMADSIDLHRKSPGRHLAFGIGRHHCIRAPLARQELITCFSLLIRRLRDFRLQPGTPELAYVPSFFGRNLVRLPIRFDRR
ncbi:cytochrome P450 [Polymorphobacter sp.]|uniref:cytochrome P450 n=1 Tax=Polymorphobacter sp. TaxID=1909290 RepID=UPI003F6FBA2F